MGWQDAPIVGPGTQTQPTPSNAPAWQSAPVVSDQTALNHQANADAVKARMAEMKRTGKPIELGKTPDIDPGELLKGSLKGGVELPARTAMGAISALPAVGAGIAAGLVSAAKRGFGNENAHPLDEYASTVNKVMAGAQRPIDATVGTTVGEGLGRGMQALHSGLGDPVFKATGSPTLAALAATSPDALLSAFTAFPKLRSIIAPTTTRALDAGAMAPKPTGGIPTPPSTDAEYAAFIKNYGGKVNPAISNPNALTKGINSIIGSDEARYAPGNRQAVNTAIADDLQIPRAVVPSDPAKFRAILEQRNKKLDAPWEAARKLGKFPVDDQLRAKAGPELADMVKPKATSTLSGTAPRVLDMDEVVNKVNILRDEARHITRRVGATLDEQATAKEKFAAADALDEYIVRTAQKIASGPNSRIIKQPLVGPPRPNIQPQLPNPPQNLSDAYAQIGAMYRNAVRPSIRSESSAGTQYAPPVFDRTPLPPKRSMGSFSEMTSKEVPIDIRAAKIAQQLQANRVLKAKTYAVLDSMDDAGYVRLSKLAHNLMSGNLATLAKANVRLPKTLGNPSAEAELIGKKSAMDSLWHRSMVLPRAVMRTGPAQQYLGTPGALSQALPQVGAASVRAAPGLAIAGAPQIPRPPQQQ